MNEETIPCPRELDRLARRYFDAVESAAKIPPRLPRDYYAPPRGRCCIAPPAMTEAA